MIIQHLTHLLHALHCLSSNISHGSKSFEESQMHLSTSHITNADYISISSEQSTCFTLCHLIIQKYISEMYIGIYVHLKQPGFKIPSPSLVTLHVHKSIHISFAT
jgi:hypothetical protein